MSAKPRRGDWVEGLGGMSGYVRRVAKDGSWADVDWGAWTKRQRTDSIKVVATIYRDGWEITDMEREAELAE